MDTLKWLDPITQEYIKSEYGNKLDSGELVMQEGIEVYDAEGNSTVMGFTSCPIEAEQVRRDYDSLRGAGTATINPCVEIMYPDGDTVELLADIL